MEEELSNELHEEEIIKKVLKEEKHIFANIRGLESSDEMKMGQLEDEERIKKRVENITISLDNIIDTCNKDPRFKHPVLSKKEDYLPIKKGSPWPEYSEGLYFWNASYEVGNTLSSGGIFLYYFPNPLEYLKFISNESPQDFVERKRKRWLDNNADLSRGLYEILSNSGFKASNNYSEILQEIKLELEKIAESRKIHQ